MKPGAGLPGCGVRGVQDSETLGSKSFGRIFAESERGQNQTGKQEICIMPRKLLDIVVDEITLCESAANRKKFFIKKMEDKVEEFIKELKKFQAADEEDGDAEKALTEGEIQKAKELTEEATKAIKGALNILNKYKADMPDDVLKAIQTLTKYASYGYPAKKEDIDKAGAKLSKTTRDQIQKVLDFIKESPRAIAALKALLGQEVQKEEPVDGAEKLSAETVAKLDEYATLKKAEDERLKAEAKKQADEDLDKLLQKKLEDMGIKKKAVKKSIDDPGDTDKDKKKDAGDEDEDDPFPSIPIPHMGPVD